MKKLLLSFVAILCAFSFVSAQDVTITATTLTDNAISDQGYTLTFAKNGGSTAPTYNANGKDNRVYAQGSVTVTAPEGTKMTQIVFNLSNQGKKRLTAITASVGNVAAQAVGDETVVWTGSDESVTFTVGDKATYGSDGASKAGQLCFGSVVISASAPSDNKQPAGLSYDKSSVEVNANELDKFVAPVLNNPNNLTLTFTSSDENVAEVDADGAVSLTGDEGEATITAEFAGDDTYRAGKASYTIVVKNVPVNESTEANPYTVAKALELAASLDASTGIEGAYIKGYIVAIKEVSTSFGNATYTIADAADATEGLTVFRGLYLNGDKFAAEDQIKVGAEVVVFGKLINYQGKTPELAQGNKIISYNYEGGDTPVELEKVNSINETFALEAGTKFIVNYPLTVAFVHGSNILLCDRSGDFIQIYLKDNGLAVGDRLPREWEATYGVRYGVPQLTPVNGLPAPTGKVDFTPREIEAADVTPAIVNHVVTVNGVVFAEATPATAENFTGTVDDVTLNFRNNYSVASVDAGTYNVTFWVNLYNDAPSLYVISYEKATTSGIDDIAADSADAVFYNLQGVKVANPENGLYIRVAGGQVSKVLVK